MAKSLHSFNCEWVLFRAFYECTDFAHPQPNRLWALSLRMHISADREKTLGINAVVALLPRHIFTCARNRFPGNFKFSSVEGAFWKVFTRAGALTARCCVFNLMNWDIFQRKTRILCTKKCNSCFRLAVWYVEGKQKTLGSFWFSSDRGLFCYCFVSFSFCSRRAIDWEL